MNMEYNEPLPRNVTIKILAGPDKDGRHSFLKFYKAGTLSERVQVFHTNIDENIRRSRELRKIKIAINRERKKAMH